MSAPHAAPDAAPRRLPSLKETVGLLMLAVGLLSMLVTALLLAVTFRRAFARQVEADLALTARDVAAAYELGDMDTVQAMGASGMRITLIGPDGTVLYENQAGHVEENHLSRPEVQQALAEGAGTARRKSATMGYDTYYRALLLADGNVLRVAMDAQNMFAIYSATLPVTALCCLAVMVLAVVGSLLLTRRVVRPIERMAENLDEIRQRTPYKELLPFAESIRRDRLARQAGEEMRREFTANVSHELKTPLTSISGYAELIAAGVAAPADVPLFAGKIKQEAGRMRSLIGDILQLSELDSAQGRPAQFTPVNLERIAREVAESRRLTAHNASVSLELELQSAGSVNGDRVQLAELCENLVDNAIRYNRPGGHVWLRTLPAADTAGPALQVADDGIGIPEEHQARVFERFYRVDKSRSKATGGTGLGLAIVKHIAQLHGASIRLESEPGRGTVITVRFPRP